MGEQPKVRGLVGTYATQELRSSKANHQRHRRAYRDLMIGFLCNVKFKYVKTYAISAYLHKHTLVK